jgi:hypothetical protein
MLVLSLLQASVFAASLDGFLISYKGTKGCINQVLVNMIINYWTFVD